MNSQDLLNIYDFSLIEKAVQAFFVAVPECSFVAPLNDDDPNREAWTAGADNIAFYTAFQSLTFTKCRPRIFIKLNDITEFIGADEIDANAVLRARAWRATLEFGVITEPNYTLHTQLRALMLALIPTLQPTIDTDNATIKAGSVNDLLTYHEVATLKMSSTTTNIAIEEDGAYWSAIPCALVFNVKATAWPEGSQA